MPRLLHHHDRLLARANRRDLRGVFDGAVSAYGGEGEVDGGVFVSEEVDEMSLCIGEIGVELGEGGMIDG